MKNWHYILLYLFFFVFSGKPAMSQLLEIGHTSFT
jgi:hypothetical protein